MPESVETRAKMLEQWTTFWRNRFAHEPRSLQAQRREAQDAFAQLGYPLSKNEDWKYTKVHLIAETSWKLAPLAPAPAEPNWPAIRVLLVNGRFVGRVVHSPWHDKISIWNWQDAFQEQLDLLEQHWNRMARWRQHPFAALNTACFQDAVIIRVFPNQEIEAPIHILIHHDANSAEPQACFPRILVCLESGSKATLVETYTGGGRHCFTCGVVELLLERGAHLDYYKVQQEHEQTVHIVQAYARLAAEAALRTHIVSLGGGLVRNECDVSLVGQHGNCTLNGLYLARGRQHVDNHTEIDHVAPACTSYELYKGILTDHAHGVFHGKIYVHPGAQKTDAKQTNQALLLSDEAEVDSKPQLEIYADDVRCTHGATVGQLDNQQLFYLRTRGISMEQARSLLIYAFAEDIISRIQVDPVRFQLEDILLAEEGLPLESDLRKVHLP